MGFNIVLNTSHIFPWKNISHILPSENMANIFSRLTYEIVGGYGHVLEGRNVTEISPYFGGPYIVGERKIYFYANLWDFKRHQYG